MELCYIFELVQAMYAQKDKKGVDVYNSVFPAEVKMCLGFMSFCAPSAALKQENYQDSPNMQSVITQISDAI